MFNNIINRFNKLKVTLVKNKCTKIYFLCIYLFHAKYTTNTFTYLCT